MTDFQIKFLKMFALSTHTPCALSASLQTDYTLIIPPLLQASLVWPSPQPAAWVTISQDIPWSSVPVNLEIPDRAGQQSRRVITSSTHPDRGIYFQRHSLGSHSHFLARKAAAGSWVLSVTETPSGVPTRTIQSGFPHPVWMATIVCSWGTLLT